jgi:hypothetical protein
LTLAADAYTLSINQGNPVNILTQETPITIGMTHFTMNMGKVVPVKVLKHTGFSPGYWMGDEYLVEYVGEETLCLDFGQNWYLRKGDTFHTRKINMDRALEWMAEKY